MKKILLNIIPLLSVGFFLNSCETKSENSETENISKSYRLNFSINDTVNVPVNFNLTKHNNLYSGIIKNASETLNLKQELLNDSILVLTSDVFGSKIELNLPITNELTGHYKNPRKGENFAIEISGIQEIERIEGKNQTTELGKYKVQFSDSPDDIAIGYFKNEKGKVTGTFNTETGDYRFLEGKLVNNELQLSCFDGAHLFYFNATLKNDSLVNGNFYSNNTYHTKWNAVKDSTIELRDPLSLTTSSADVIIRPQFNIPNPNAEITIVQLLGTWCPNCMDESKFYAQELLSKYDTTEVNIVGLAYEYISDENTLKTRINKFKKDLNISYPIHFAGKASKTVASESFPELNKVISFPTSIYLDKNGKVLRIHTGFYGPGTGSKYNEFKTELYQFLDNQLK